MRAYDVCRGGVALFRDNGACRRAARRVRKRFQHFFGALPREGQRPAFVNADTGRLYHGVETAQRLPDGAYVFRHRHDSRRDSLLRHD